MKESFVSMSGDEKPGVRNYRVVYWFGSVKTDYFIRADSKEDAERKFVKSKGDRNVIRIEEM